MKRFLLPIGSLCAAALLSLALAGCPMQASYKSTITPIYAATAKGLWVYNGSSWAQYLPSSAATSVVVSGSGSGADVYVGTANGVSHSSTNGASWTNWAGNTNGLGTAPVNKLFLGSNILAATAGGVSSYNLDGSSTIWTTDTSKKPVTDVFSYGTYRYVLDGSNLYIYNGTSTESTYSANTILLSSTSVNAVIADSYLNIIVGTNYGLVVLYYDKTGTFTNSGNYLPNSTSINGLFLDSNDYIYAATANGIYKIGSSLTQMLSGTPVLSVFVDGAGTIYAGTSANGLQISKDGGSTWTTELTSTQTGAVNAVVTTAPLYSF
jgi:ligand-binding sensor domain-containing protein